MKTDPDVPVAVAVDSFEAEVAASSTTETHSAEEGRPRLPVKRRLFPTSETTGAQQRGQTGHAADASATPPILVRSIKPHRRRLKRREFKNRYGTEPVVFLKVGDRALFDYTISVGQRGEVMASELCDVAKQTVLVRSTQDIAANNTAGSGGFDWGANCSPLQTPPDSVKTSPVLKQEWAAESGGDCVPCGDAVAPKSAQTGPDGDGCPSLMWLLDYRLDHLMKPTPENPLPSALEQRAQRATPRPRRSTVKARPQLSASEPKKYSFQQQQQFLPPHQQPTQQEVRPPRLQKQPSRQERQKRYSRPQTLDQDTAARTDQLDNAEDTYDSVLGSLYEGGLATTATKPPFTYTELIEQAMVEHGELTVADIYKWIASNFSFYKSSDDRWKNSVRHNLSLNPHFQKVGKAHSRGGHLWALASATKKRFKKHIVASQNSRSDTKQAGTSGEIGTSGGELTFDLCDDTPLPANDIWLSSAADNKENIPIGHVQLLNCAPEEAVLPTTFTLEESADRILSGSSHQVEVQFIGTGRSERISSEPTLADYQTLDGVIQG